MHDVIVAPATAAGSGPRAIVRLAGDGLAGVLEALVEPTDARGFPGAGEPPRAVAARLALAGPGREWGPLPVTVLHWPGPGGPIGGPLAEVQLPGCAPLVEAVVAEACRRGARLARGGEFTLRTFLAGRLDLVQAEAVLGVVDARTPAELAAALDRMAGGAGAALAAVRSALLDLLADVEAAIDFADEATPDAVPVADAAARARNAARLAGIRADLAGLAAGLASRAGGHGGLPRVVLVGRPNIGKSSLFNALVGRAAALVADEAGTTRDWLAAPLAGAGGMPACLLVDLAGFAEAGGPAGHGDPLAAVVMAAAGAEAARADVIVACCDVDDPAPPPAAVDAPPRIEVRTRSDRAVAPATTDAADPVIRTSVATGLGLDELRAAIATAVAALPAGGTPATARMAVGVAECAAALEAAAAPAAAADDAVAAGHLHRAVAALDEITGAALGTDLLDRIFARHCVGK